MELTVVEQPESEVEALPNGWALVPLGSLGRWLSGGTPSMSKGEYWDGDIPWVSPKDMKRARLHDSIDHVGEKALSNGTRLAPRHALLMVVRGMILAHSFPVARAERPLAFNQDIKALVTHDDVDSDFLLWWLQANRSTFLSITTESTHGTKRMPTQTLFNQDVLLPPTEEQRAIAAALSDVDALLAALDRLIAKKRAVKTAAMQQLLTGRQRLPGFTAAWETKKLSEIGSTYGGLTGKSKRHFGIGSARYVPFMNVMSNAVIDTNYLERVDVAKNESQNEVHKGDLLFNTSSETPEELGMCAAVMDDLNSVYLNSFCFGFRMHNSANSPLYLAYTFRGDPGRNLMYSLAQGATRYNLSKRNFLNLELQLPPPDEQNAIATVLSDMDAEIAALEARRDKTKQIKRGMMQELLTGRTRLLQHA